MCSLHTLETTIPLIREMVALPQSFRCLPTAIAVIVPSTGTTKGLLGGGYGRGEKPHTPRRRGKKKNHPGFSWIALTFFHSTHKKGRCSRDALSVYPWCVFLGFRLPLIPGWLLEGKNDKFTAGSVGLQSLVFFPRPTCYHPWLEFSEPPPCLLFKLCRLVRQERQGEGSFPSSLQPTRSLHLKDLFA